MGLLLFLAFIVIPILEIAVFIQVGGLIGLVPTLVCIFATAIIGVALLRYQGFAVIRRANEAAQAGRVPVAEVFDGFCLVVAGVFLLTPGFVTDALGFVLLIPAVRTWLRLTFGARLAQSATVTVGGMGPGQPGHGQSGPGQTGPGQAGSGSAPGRDKSGSTVIDADYEDLTDQDTTPEDRPGAPRLPATRDDSPWKP